MIVFFRSLQSRLILLILLVALPGLGGLIYESVLERRSAINSAQNHAINTVSISTDFQSHLIEKTEHFLKSLSTFSVLLNPDSPECSAFLAQVLKVNDSYINIGVPRADGELICNAQPLTREINVSDRPYFKKVMSTGSFSVGEYQIDRAANISSINFAYPVVNPKTNKIVAATVAVISLSWWSERLLEANLPKHTLAYITDHEDKIIASYPSSPNLIGTKLSKDNFDITSHSPHGGFASKSNLGNDEQLRVFIQRPLLTDSNLINITVGVPFGEELSAINSRLIKSGAILVFVVMIMLVIATWGIQRTLIRPLKVLTASAKKLEKGINIGDIPQYGSTELIELQQRFTSMAKTRLNAEKELKSSQESLLESKNQLLDHIKNTPLGCISWDKALNCTKWNRSAERIFGYSESEAIGKHAGELILLPELKSELTEVFHELLNNQGGKYRTNQNRTKSGEIIICEWHSTPILAPDGSVIGATSLVQDVTQNKQLEEQLKLAASVFSHAREGIIITDNKGIIIDVNATFTDITGYTKNEVVGLNPSILKSNRQSTAFYKALWQSVKKNGHWSGEIWNKRKNGDIYAELLTITSVHNSNGALKNYIAIFSDISDAKEQQSKLEHMAHYDVLTNLPNRTLLAERLDFALTQCKENDRFVAVVLLDLDGFKEINDTYGHSIGDQLLVILANRLKGTLRKSDTISRFGGDEFVAVLANLVNATDYKTIINNMLKVASEPVRVKGNQLHVSASIGVTVFPNDKTDADQLIRHADQAMYLAKQKGKNCYHLFDIESEDAIKARHEVIQRIASALKNKEFVLYYQPKVNMRTGGIIGMEALIRWQHPERGMLSPAEFLPYIENHKLSIDVGEWVIKESLRQYREWKENGLSMCISVNVSAQQIQQRNFPLRLEALLNNFADVPPQALQLEVLETSELRDISNVSEIMGSCVSLGVSFAIDDFGTGYSSLTYLRRFPANVIKIDQTFVRDMLIDPEDRAIVVGVIALAKSFNRSVIAEGVETIAHGTKLIELGCDLAQGYGIAKPMPAKDVSTWVKQWKTSTKWKTAEVAIT